MAKYNVAQLHGTFVVVKCNLFNTLMICHVISQSRKTFLQSFHNWQFTCSPKNQNVTLQNWCSEARE